MLVVKSRYLGAAAMAAMIAHATTAQAQFALPSARIVGAGSSAIAHTIRQASDCYGLKSDLGFGTAKLSPYSIDTISVPDVDFNTTYADTLGNRFNCGANSANAVIATSPYAGPQFAVGRIVQPNVMVEYLSVGSQEGVAAFIGGRVNSQIRISAKFSDRDGSFYYGLEPANCPVVAGPDCAGYDSADGYQFSLSEIPLFRSGYPQSYTGTYADYFLESINPFDRYNNINPNYGNRNAYRLFGSPIQVPVAIVPIAIAYSPAYAKQRNGDGSISTYRLTVGNARADGSGGLRLSRDQYCAIFNGAITNWNQLPTSVVNKDPADVNRNWATTGLPIYLVGRADASGTTTLLTRALMVQCTGLSINTGVGGVGGTTIVYSRFPGSFSQLSSRGALTSGAFFDKYLGKFRDQNTYPRASANYCAFNGQFQVECQGLFTIAEGDDGVAMATTYLPDPGLNPGDRTSNGRIAYISPEQTLPAILFNVANNFGLNTASLQVGGYGYTYAAPDAKNATAAFGKLQPPQSKGTTGFYCADQPTCSQNGDRGDPLQWVESVQHLPVFQAPYYSPLAAPTKGYPIVGTSNVLLYTCYATSDRRQAIDSFFATLFGKTTREHNNQMLPVNIFADPVVGTFARNGIAPMPASWRTAITETFLKRSLQIGKIGDLTTRLGDRNLWIQDKLAYGTPAAPGVTTANPTCASKPGA